MRNIQKAAGILLLLAASVAHANESVTVFAAASLANVLMEIGERYEKATGIKIKHSFASSSALAKQIEAGAPAGIFVSANREWMDYLLARNLIDGASRRNWLGNRLVLIAPKGRSFTVEFTRHFDFVKAFKGRLCTGNVDAVPAGIYARQALNQLNWWNSIKKRIVGAEDVRGALAFVERGECGAGIVYESDARVSDKVEIVVYFPENTHDPIIYPVAFVAGAKGLDKDYMEYLQRPGNEAIFAKYGFRIIK
ncbi:MAG TPA: molybdate ABC transporter substrate-binding protein [Methylophilaceae bacterium]|nr:molybdate ABC transporter substrate-binding protein [Methylophilaceae bacterium]